MTWQQLAANLRTYSSTYLLTGFTCSLNYWQRWMTWRQPASPPVAEASLIAAADVLVTTDELSAERDATGALRGGFHVELNVRARDLIWLGLA